MGLVYDVRDGSKSIDEEAVPLRVSNLASSREEGWAKAAGTISIQFTMRPSGYVSY